MSFNFKNAAIVNFVISGLTVLLIILVASLGGCNG